MDINFIEQKSGLVVFIDNFYDQQELNGIKSELIKLNGLECFNGFSNKCALDGDGNKKQNSKSVFLDDYFLDDRNLSEILKINRKLFFCTELKNALLNKSIFYKHIYESTYDATLVNFYSGNGFYKPHKDTTMFTVLSIFSLEEFVGGNLIFPELQITVEAKDNRLIIFPGCLEHGAEEVKSGLRVSMAQFLNYRV